MADEKHAFAYCLQAFEIAMSPYLNTIPCSTSIRFRYFVFTALIILSPLHKTKLLQIESTVEMKYLDTLGYADCMENEKFIIAETFGYFPLNETKAMRFATSVVIPRNFSASWRGSSGMFVIASGSIYPTIFFSRRQSVTITVLKCSNFLISCSICPVVVSLKSTSLSAI